MWWNRCRVRSRSRRLEYEVVWLIPAHLLGDDIEFDTEPLDLAAEIARYGRDTRGGPGISVPLDVQLTA